MAALPSLLFQLSLLHQAKEVNREMMIKIYVKKQGWELQLKGIRVAPESTLLLDVQKISWETNAVMIICESSLIIDHSESYLSAAVVSFLCRAAAFIVFLFLTWLCRENQVKCWFKYENTKHRLRIYQQGFNHAANLVLFADIVELKAPGMSPNPAEHLKVLEQVYSNPPTGCVRQGAHTWKKQTCVLQMDGNLRNQRFCVQHHDWSLFPLLVSGWRWWSFTPQLLII